MSENNLNAEKIVSKAVLSAFLRAGYTNYSANEIKVITDAIFKWLEMSGKGMTVEDVEKAIELGSFGEFGSFVGINAVNVISWIRTWKFSPKRFQQKKAVDVSKQIPETATLSKEEQRMKDFEWIEKCKIKQNYNDFGHVLYHALYRQRLIEITPELIEKAAQAVKEEKIEEGRKKVASFQMGSGQLLSLIEQMDKTPAEVFRSEIRHKLVEWWLIENK